MGRAGGVSPLILAAVGDMVCNQGAYAPARHSPFAGLSLILVLVLVFQLFDGRFKLLHFIFQALNAILRVLQLLNLSRSAWERIESRPVSAVVSVPNGAA